MTERCGSETTDGTPCEWPVSKKGPCPWHDSEEDNTRNTLLEEKPEITHIVAGELQNESTVPEACAEANISTGQYGKWYARGAKDGVKDIFVEFRKECRRARMIAAGSDREEVKDVAKNEGDARTLWKAHMQQYGDIYAEEGIEPPEEVVGFGVPDKLIEQWQQQMQ